MENTTVNRRKAIKSALLGIGGLTVLPAIPWGASAHTPTPFWTHQPRLTAPVFPWKDYPLKAKLNANENKFGPSTATQKAILSSVNSGNLYAHQEVIELTKMLADKEGVKPEQIMLGPGSTDLLEKIAVISFMDGTGNIVSADPAYMSVVRSAQRVGATWKNIPANAREMIKP